MTDVVATGNCYEAAVMTALDLPEADRDRYRIVHGYPTGQGKIAGVVHDHAWIERFDPMPDDVPEVFQRADLFITCIDKSNGKDIEWPRTLYYGIGNINPADCIYYTIDEAFRTCNEYNHFGPWNDENPPLPDDDDWDDEDE